MSIVGTYRRLLGNQPLVRLLAGEFVSRIGDWLYLVALLVVVYTESHSATVLGLVGAARVAPYILLSVPAGIAADRFDRRQILLVTDIARGLVMLLLAWLVATHGPLLAIVALAILAYCFSAFFGPAIGAFVPSLVKDESELGPANSAMASLDNLAFVVGPAIAGLLIAASGLSLAFVLNAVSFGVIALILWRLPRRSPVASPGMPAAVRTADADRAGEEPGTAPRGGLLGAEPRRLLAPLAGVVLIDAADYFVYGGLGVLTVVVAVEVLGAGEAATGYLNAAIGVGGLLGAVSSGALVLRRRLAPPLGAGAIALGIGFIALGWSGALSLSLLAMAVIAFGDILVVVVGMTIIQRTVPDAVRGRVLGSLQTLGATAYAAGSLAMPVAAGAIGTGQVLVVSGAAMIAIAVVALVLLGQAATDAPAPISAAAARFLTLSILAGLSPARLETAARRLTRVPVAASEAVVRQGDPADRFYFIASGSFVVTKQAAHDAAPQVLRRLGPDEFFGEIGLLNRVPRTATVAAETDGEVLALEGADFLELVGSRPALGSRFLARYPGATATG